MDIAEVTREGFIKRRFISPLLHFLKQGVRPEKLAWAVAWGAVISVFPVFGSTTLLCAALALMFRLNMAAIQLVNYFMYPLQFVLYIPYLRMGEWLFKAPRLQLSVSQILGMIKNDALGAVNFLWWATIHAIAAWTLTGPLAAVLIYLIFKAVFRKIAPKVKAEELI